MHCMARSAAAEESTAVTVIAVDRDKNSRSAVKWAVDNLIGGRSTQCILVHVTSRNLYLGDVDFVASGGRPSTEAELQQLFLPFCILCARRGIAAKEVILHGIDVPSTLIDYIANNPINNIVIGASSHNAITRQFKALDVPSSLLKSAPQTCAVYVISKDKLQNVRAANRCRILISDSTRTSKKGTPKKSDMCGFQAMLQPDTPESLVFNRSPFSFESRRSQSSESGITYSKESNGFGQTNSHSLRKNSSSLAQPLETYVTGNLSIQISSSDVKDFTRSLSFHSNDMSNKKEVSPESQYSGGLDSELAKLRLELQQSLCAYNLVCKEVAAAEHRAGELQQVKTADFLKCKESMLPENIAVALPSVEKQKASIVMEVVQLREAEIKQNAEETANHESGVRKTVIDSLAQKNVFYRRYTVDEIEVATDYFSSSVKIGEGGYGPVFKACLDHTSVAVKVLRPDVSQGLHQFQKEVEVLSCMRHPNMVLLVGACPEYGCLIYEYMENGSLEDRLFCKNDTPPVPWRTRFKIAAEIASGLLFLHQTKPEPLVHRDIKPSNILLDRHYVSKISDVGLARLVPPSVTDKVTEYRITAAAGTFCYIDPEYQQTGMLGVKSDVYSFGVVLLQIITAKPPTGLATQVQLAINNGRFSEVLDPAVEDWPVEEALSLAKMALRCCELRKRDRPDLGSEVLPELIRLKNFGLDAETFIQSTVSCTSHPCNSRLEMGSQCDQINVRGRWQRLKLKAGMWSLKSSFKKVISSGRKQGELNPGKMPAEGCWSFVNCSTANSPRTPQTKRFQSFS